MLNYHVLIINSFALMRYAQFIKLLKSCKYHRIASVVGAADDVGHACSASTASDAGTAGISDTANAAGTSDAACEFACELPLIHLRQR